MVTVQADCPTSCKTRTRSQVPRLPACSASSCPMESIKDGINSILLCWSQRRILMICSVSSQSWPGLLPPSFPRWSGRSRGDRCSPPLLLTCSWLLILRRMALPPLHFFHSCIPRLAHDGRKEKVAQREGRRQRQWQEWTAFTATMSDHPAWDRLL